MAVWIAIVVPLVTIAVSTAGAYWAARLRASGRVENTDANKLWDAINAYSSAQAVELAALRVETVAQRAEISRMHAELRAVRSEANRLRAELRALRSEGRKVRRGDV